jgi:ATP-dependent helicase/nuclease subunit A
MEPNRRTGMAETHFPPDQRDRDRIRTDLRTNMLVEAGAGSGKTTAMVGRMVELIRTGTAAVDEIAAVTFTRKAAAELRERFQEALECAAVQALEASQRQRLATALDRIDRCFLGTIHSFCATLIRERPLEAGVTPDFTEISGAEESRIQDEAWTRYIERAATRGGSSGGGNRLLRALADVGIRPEDARRAYEEISCNPDVSFPRVAAPPPAADRIATVRRRLERLLEDTVRHLPATEPEAGWDVLQARIRFLRYSRDVLGWDDPLSFFEALDTAVRTPRMTLNRWAPRGPGQAPIQELKRRWTEFGGHTGGASPALELHSAWLEFRYPKVMRFGRAAAAFYARERRRRGQLTFQDLLVHAAELLRHDAGARRELGDRYRYILVDEFQDTDPLQAEILFLLAADAEPDSWATATPRPGALFVVGDPKQSIYRFRRADISVYNQVKERFETSGQIVRLTANFRSTTAIASFVNATFETRFPTDHGEHQAAYAPLVVDPRKTTGRVGSYELDGDLSKKEKVLQADSALLGSWIADRIAGGRAPGDFLILVWRRKELAPYARELERRNIPFQITGAEPGVEEELRELLLVLRALMDPGNAVLVAAVLRGLFYGLSDQALYDHRRDGGSFGFLAAGERGDPRVAAALAELRELWELTRRLPADASVPKIADRLGVLPYALSGELGAMRAGAVLYALDAVQAAALRGETSLPAAVEALQAALKAEAEAPLVPGEADVVRLMNLHKAKGLEARVVVLAAPTARSDHPPVRHVARERTGRATGWLLVEKKEGRGRVEIARPRGWDGHAAAEAPFAEAEEDRLLYVAATRAREELVIARCTATADTSRWAKLHDALELPHLADTIQPSVLDPPPRTAAATSPDEVIAGIRALAERRAQLGTPSYRDLPVSVRAKRPAGPGGSGGAAGARPGPSRAPGSHAGAGTDPSAPDPKVRGSAADRAGDREMPPMTATAVAGELVPPGDPLPAVAAPDTSGLGSDRPEEPSAPQVEGRPGAGASGGHSADGSAPPVAAEFHALVRGSRGADWGTAVHQALEAATAGVAGNALREHCRKLLIALERPLAPCGEPLELEELVALVTHVTASSVWRRALRSERWLSEATFSITLTADEFRATFGRTGDEMEPAPLETIQGVVDLVFHEPDGWVVVDYKTDDFSRPEVREQRIEQYRKQVEMYAACWSRITSEPVKERVLYLTGLDEEVRW